MDTYEKKYKEAQKWIESIYSELSHEQQMEAEAFFPELKESEDERISKEIIKYLERTVPHHHRDEVLKSKEWTAWLEKQDPKKHEEELEKAYKTADEVQYKRGYEDGVKDTEKQCEQKPAAWSEEDEKILKDILVDVKFEGYNNDMLANSYKKINWLKSLKEKFKIQTRQGISKEDEYSFMLISGLIRQDQDLSLEDKNKLRLWLKSIIYQSRWKPSDEQMKALWNVYQGGQEQAELATLYNDLKKLRGE